MNITLVTGSHRPDSQSKRMANLIKDHYLQGFDKIFMHHLADMQLPFWDEGLWQGDKAWGERLAPVRADLENSDAFVIVTPEWSGMVTPMLKNYFLLAGKGMAHKPALIVSVSSGMGGAYPVAELRSSSYKNTKICYIPEHIIFRGVEQLFTGKNPDLDAEIGERVQYCCDVLTGYSKALKSVRELPVDFEKFGYGP